jgi:hypothetical protein
MENDHFDALVRGWSRGRSRRRAIALLGGALTAPFLMRQPADAQVFRECPATWRPCNGRCIPPTRCCTSEDCLGGAECRFGICAENTCNSDSDCPSFHVCRGGECIPF